MPATRPNPMPVAPHVLFRNDWSGSATLFENPKRLIVAHTPAEVEAAFAAAEEAKAAGKWLAGYFSYETGYLLEPKLQALLPEGRRAPLICLGVFDGPVEVSPGNQAADAGSRDPIRDAQATWSLDAYAERFARLHEHLRRGDCYQANLTFPIEARWAGDPLAAFDALTARQPVRYGALVSLGDPVVLSRSPELFFQVDDDGWIEAHPMKGTAPRGSTPTEDLRLRQELRADPKNQAENRMIVDLLRNDISLISEAGSLDVPELFRVETYPTLHTLVSRVRAKLRPHLSLRDIFAALFPCGSITGAPKIRAMEILRGLEDRPRDVYCGGIGWVSPSGRMRFSVAIRTISLFADGRATYNVGGGVVFDSTAEGEYQECLLKARFATGTAPIST